MNKMRYVLPVWLLCLLALSAQAKEVTLKNNDLTLNANLELAEGKELKDGVVLILHGFLAHNRMEIIESSQTALLDNDQSSLAINLSFGIDNRHGFYDCLVPIRHKLSDAMDELDAWIDWLKAEGVSHLVLMGHSISANQVLIYTAKRKNPLIQKVVLLAPNTVGYPNSPERYRENYGSDLTEVLTQAKQLINKGQADQLMKETDYGFCPKATVSADAFHDFYRLGNDFWQAHLFLPKVDVPVLVIAASEDERQPNVTKHIKPYVDDKRIFLTIIDGAGHFFRDLNMDEAIEAAVEFVGE